MYADPKIAQEYAKKVMKHISNHPNVLGYQLSKTKRAKRDDNSTDKNENQEDKEN